MFKLLLLVINHVKTKPMGIGIILFINITTEEIRYNIKSFATM